jgi:hypothetical protein
MENRQTIQKVNDELQQRPSDIKAEAWLNQALENGLLPSDFVVINNRFFEREFTQDISRTNIVEADWLNHYLEVQLSRPGLYDMLPEGLFFQPKAADMQRVLSVAEMAAQYRVNKIKEREIRRFFQPVENEFFYQQVQLEQEEVWLLDGLKGGKLNRFFLQFWDLPAALDVSLALSLLILLPYAHQICGHTGLMQEVLGLLLQEPVFIKKGRPQPTAVNDLVQPLGMQALGDTMVCGTEFMEDYPVLEYQIGPLKNSTVTSYLAGGENELLIQTFNRFFAPLDADIIVNIEIEKSQTTMEMSETVQPVLGYTSVL